MVDRSTLPSELECESAIIKAARLAGWRVHAERTSRTGSGNYATAIKGDRGFCDLTMVRNGQLVFVELKRDRTGRVGPGQQEWVDALSADPGVAAFFCYVPSSMPALIAKLTQR